MTWEHWTIAALWLLGGITACTASEDRSVPDNWWEPPVIIAVWPFLLVYAIAMGVFNALRGLPK